MGFGFTVSPYSAWLLLLVLLAGSTPAAAAIERYEGLAYAKGSQRLLYSEEHWLQPGAVSRLVLYRCPDGKPFARKRVTGAGATPDFEFIDGRSGYSEGVRTRGGRREVFARESSSAAEQRSPIAPGKVQIIDAGFDSYVRQRWDALAPPGQTSVSFLVPSRLQPMDFKLRPSTGPSGSRTFRLSLDAWYGRALPGIAVTYAARGSRLLQFEGIGNIRDAAGKYPPVRIEFPEVRRRAANDAEQALAATAPLVKSCRAT